MPLRLQGLLLPVDWANAGCGRPGIQGCLGCPLLSVPPVHTIHKRTRMWSLHLCSRQEPFEAQLTQPAFESAHPAAPVQGCSFPILVLAYFQVCVQLADRCGPIRVWVAVPRGQHAAGLGATCCPCADPSRVTHTTGSPGWVTHATCPTDCGHRGDIGVSVLLLPSWCASLSLVPWAVTHAWCSCAKGARPPGCVALVVRQPTTVVFREQLALMLMGGGQGYDTTSITRQTPCSAPLI